MNDTILKIKDLRIQYVTQELVAHAVNGISFELKKGETIGIVGETGAGKTTTALGIMRLLPKETGRVLGGSIEYDGDNLLELKENEMRCIRGKNIAMIYQDPMTSLNPVLTVGEQVAEGLKIHTNLTSNEINQRVDQLLEMVGIPKSRKHEYPHQFSGGMKQRIVIAMALICNPNILIADEPTTALDVTIQAQVLQLMNELRTEFDTSMIFITHDLGVIVKMCDHVAIMYGGEIVEYGTTKDIYTNYKHPYVQGLFDSIPSLHKKVERLKSIEGLMADSTDLPNGCKFHPRCEKCMDICKITEPKVVHFENEHQVRCHLYGEDNHE